MAIAFDVSRVQDALIPEAGGIITTAGLEIGAAIADDKTDWKRPWIQNGATAVAIGLPVYFIGTGRYTQFSKGMLYTALGMMLLNVGRAISQKSLRKPTQARLADFAALVPQETVVLSKVLSSPSAQAQAKRMLRVEESPRISVGSVESSGNGEREAREMIPTVEYE